MHIGGELRRTEPEPSTLRTLAVGAAPNRSLVGTFEGLPEGNDDYDRSCCSEIFAQLESAERTQGLQFHFAEAAVEALVATMLEPTLGAWV